MASIWNWLAGGISGFLGALGVGGGGVLVLYLTELAGFGQLAAQGVNLLFFLPTGAVALFFHTKNRLVHWRGLAWTVGGGLLGVGVGTFLAGFLGGDIVGKLFALMMMIMGIGELRAKKTNRRDP